MVERESVDEERVLRRERECALMLKRKWVGEERERKRECVLMLKTRGAGVGGECPDV